MSKIFPRLKEALSGSAFDQPVVNIPLISRPLGNGLNLFFIEDRGATSEYVDRNRQRELGVSEKELFSLSIRNLANRAVDQARIGISDHGVTMLVGMEDLESSLCLVPAAVAKFGFAPSSSVFAIPTREIFMFANGRNVQALTLMKSIAQKHFREAQRSHRVSERLFRASESGLPLKLASGSQFNFTSISSFLLGKT